MPSTVVPVAAAGADEINTGRNYDSLTDKMSPSNKPSPTMVHRQSSIVDIFAAGAMVESVAGAVAGTVASGMKGMSAHACNGVSFDNWNVMSDDVKQAVSAVADKVYPPDGIDEALWDHLDDATRAKVREQCNAVVAAKTKRGNVVRFFFDFTSQQASDYYDSSVSSMALICALLLTIPFSIGGYFNDSYFEALEASFAACSGGVALGVTYNDQFKKYLQSLACTIYCSMVGLSLSTLYYLFKADKNSKTSRMTLFKRKLLIISIFTATVLAVVGLLAFTTVLFNYYIMQFKDVCTYNAQSTWGVGVALLAVSFAYGVFLTW